MSGDEPQGTMGRVQTPVVSLPPSFARPFSSRERRLGTRQECFIDYKHQYDGVSCVVEMKFTFSGQESLYRGWEHIDADDVTPFSPYLMMRSCANFNRLKRFSIYFWVN